MTTTSNDAATSPATLGLSTESAGPPRTETVHTEANAAWEALLGAHATLMRRFEAESMWCEVSLHEYDVLYTLSKCPNPQRLGELGRHVMLSQPGLSRLVERLVERGLIAKGPDPVDARATLLALTDEGRSVQRRVGRAHALSVAEALSSRLSPTQMSELSVLATLLTSPELFAPMKEDPS